MPEKKQTGVKDMQMEAGEKRCFFTQACEPDVQLSCRESSKSLAMVPAQRNCVSRNSDAAFRRGSTIEAICSLSQ